MFRSPKKPEPGAAPSKRPDRPAPKAPSGSEADVASTSAKRASNVPTPESPVPRPRPLGSKQPPPSPTLPVVNGDADAEDAPARRPAANASDANANANLATRVIATPSPMKATVHEKREKDDENAPEDARAKQDVSDVSDVSAQVQQKKKKKKGGDPEKAARAAHYAAVNAAHAADAAAAARALRGRLDQAKKERETDSDLAEQTRAQLEMLLSERARASTTIAKLRRDREDLNFLLAHQSVALDEAEATVERLRAELREKEALLREGKTGGVGEPADRGRGGTGGERGGGGGGDDDDDEARSERQ